MIGRDAAASSLTVILGRLSEVTCCGFLPPPGLRMRAVAFNDASAWPVSISWIPRLIVFGEIRRALLTIVIPPRPRLIASVAAHKRRCRSFNNRPDC